MKNVKQIRDLKAQTFEEMEALNQAASTEKRSLTAEESTKFNDLAAKMEALDVELRQAETFEKRAAENAAAGAGINHTPEQKEVRNYSLARAIMGQINGKLDGLEKEMHDEAVREARESKVDIKNLGVPSFILESRDNSVTMPTQPEDGSVLVQKTVGGMINLLRPNLAVEQLGATIMRGLTGTLSMPSHTTGATASWVPEVGELAKSNLKFGNIEMAPKRLGTYAVVSKQLLLQASPDVDRILRQDLRNATDEAVDIAALYGSGTSNQPLGVLNAAGITVLPGATNGAAPTYEMLLALEAAIDANNALRGSLGYAINSKTMAKLRGTRLDAGSGLFVMNDINTLNGYKAVSTNLVPSNLTKGSGTNLSAIIFGNWADLLIGQWGGLDIMADPYTLATAGQIRLIVDSFWDVAVRRAASFAAVKDVITTLS